MRVIIATRIFGPEVSAASGILRTWAEEFRDAGWDVTILTARPPKGAVIDDPAGITVRRAPVKRDKQQYVRGYLSYMSFDLPLVWRLLCSRTADLYIVEPPPTTVAVVRVIAALKRRPYAVRAADYWTEAAELVVRSKLIVRILGAVEAWGLQGARILFAAHEPLIARLRSAGVTTEAIPIGFGADTKDFRYEGQAPPEDPVFVYAGTHASWHGAGIFVEALALLTERYPHARLLYYGNGEEREPMRQRAAELGLVDRVEFHAPVPPAVLSPILASATASVASLAPVPANTYAVATKAYSSLAAGCPVIFAGVGPTDELLTNSGHPDAGVAVSYDASAAAEAMALAAANPLSPARRRDLAEWSATRFSLKEIARTIVERSATLTRSTAPST